MKTDTPFHPHHATSPAEAASQWSARLHSGRFTPADQQALEDWLQADPEHEREFQAAEQVTALAGTLDKDLVQALYGGALPLRPDLRRRKLLRGAGALATVAGTAGLTGLLLRPQPVYAVSLDTRIGERRQVALPDGSSLELNTGTQAELRFYDHSRRVELRQGEILFSIQHDAERPFIVKAGSTEIRVTGTRFTVRRDAEHTQVLVDSGSVEVSSGPWWNRHVRYLPAGAGAYNSAQEGLTLLPNIDFATATAWRQGRLIVRDAPLSQVIAEINRYHEQPIRFAQAQTGNLRVTASFLLDEPQALLQALQQIAPLRANVQTDGSVLLISTP